MIRIQALYSITLGLLCLEIPADFAGLSMDRRCRGAKDCIRTPS